jgi:menaquinone-dependent protoporphyrinogen oxidase
MKILVAYASKHGSTREAAEFMGRVLKAYSVEVDVMDVRDVQSVSVYDAAVIGSAIYGGLWLQEMSLFIEKFSAELASRPLYLYITCIRALELDGRSHAEKYYINHKALEGFDLRDVGVLTGKLNTSEIDHREQWYLVANYDGKLTSANVNEDFRDWQAIAAWANKVAADLHLEPSFSAAT